MRRPVVYVGISVAAVLLFGIVWQQRASTNGIKQFPPPGRMIDMGGWRAHLHCGGTASPTVVLDSGIGAASYEWAHTFERLRKHVRVCTYDRGGYGWSDPSPAARTSMVIARELHALLQKAGEAGPFALVGHSFGGVNVRLFASLYPAETAGIVLVDSMVEDDKIPFLKILPMWLVKTTAPVGLPRLFRRLVTTRELPPAEQAAADALRATTSAYRTAFEEMRMFEESAAQLRESRIPQNLPVAILTRTPRGSEEDQRHIELQTQLTKLSPRSIFVVAKNSRHFVQLDEPETVVRVALELVAAVKR